MWVRMTFFFPVQSTGQRKKVSYFFHISSQDTEGSYNCFQSWRSKGRAPGESVTYPRSSRLPDVLPWPSLTTLSSSSGDQGVQGRSPYRPAPWTLAPVGKARVHLQGQTEEIHYSMCSTWIYLLLSRQLEPGIWRGLHKPRLRTFSKSQSTEWWEGLALRSPGSDCRSQSARQQLSLNFPSSLLNARMWGTH